MMLTITQISYNFSVFFLFLSRIQFYIKIVEIVKIVTLSYVESHCFDAHNIEMTQFDF